MILFCLRNQATYRVWQSDLSLLHYATDYSSPLLLNVEHFRALIEMTLQVLFPRSFAAAAAAMVAMNRLISHISNTGM